MKIDGGTLCGYESLSTTYVYQDVSQVLVESASVQRETSAAHNKIHFVLQEASLHL